MKRKKFILVISAGLLSLVLLMTSMVACGEEETTPATSAAPTTPVKTVTLSMAPGGIPNVEALFGAIPWWASEVEKRTQGRVKVEVYYGETLAKQRENWDALQSGLADVIFPAPHHAPGKLPLFTLGNVPGLSDDYWVKSWAFYELMTTDKALLDEFAAFGGIPVGGAYYPPVGLISKSPLTTLDQVKGMKISAMAPSSDLLSKFQAAPLSLSPPEQYEALLRGTVDAIAAPVCAVIDFKFYEVGKYFTRFNLGDRNHAIIISENALAKLTPQDQQIIKGMAEEYTQAAYDATAVGLEPRGVDVLKQNGVEIIVPNAADAAKLLTAAQDLSDAWVKEMDGKGLPGTALMNHYKELIKKYEAKSPYKK